MASDSAVPKEVSRESLLLTLACVVAAVVICWNL